MKAIVLPLIFLFITPSLLAQQDPLISSYQFNQLPFNPAYAGVNDVTSFDLHYRSQWGDIEGSPRSLFLSGNTSLNMNKVGAGFVFLHDNLGAAQHTDFSFNIAYELDITNSVTLSFGLQPSLISINFNFEKLNLYDPSDEDFFGGDDNLVNGNIGTGFFLSAPNYYIGLSVPRLLNVSEEIEGLSGVRYNRHIYLSGGVIFDQLASIKIKPFTLIRMTEGTPLTYDLGASVLFSNLVWAGFFTRNFDNVGLSAWLMLENGLRVGYVGEITVSDRLISPGLSTHEISIGIDLELFKNQAATSRDY